ncbi:MAG: hypothetical protein V4675_09885 [Verrucomicrobiota bacterium]
MKPAKLKYGVGHRSDIQSQTDTPRHNEADPKPNQPVVAGGTTPPVLSSSPQSVNLDCPEKSWPSTEDIVRESVSAADPPTLYLQDDICGSDDSPNRNSSIPQVKKGGPREAEGNSAWRSRLSRDNEQNYEAWKILSHAQSRVDYLMIETVVELIKSVAPDLIAQHVTPMHSAGAILEYIHNTRVLRSLMGIQFFQVSTVELALGTHGLNLAQSEKRGKVRYDLSRLGASEPEDPRPTSPLNGSGNEALSLSIFPGSTDGSSLNKAA